MGPQRNGLSTKIWGCGDPCRVISTSPRDDEVHRMKNWLIGAVVVAVAATTTPVISEAKRLGGGSSSGMQRNMPARTAPDAPPAKPAAPAQNPTQAPAQQAAPAAAGATAAAAAGKRSWLGPIAGLAAGLGLAALMSHLGLGEAFANFLMLALLVVAGIALFAFIRRRMGGAAAANRPAWAGAGAGNAAPAQAAWPQRATPAAPATPAAEPATLQRSALDAAPAATATGSAAPAVTQAFVPASFDAEGFERIAKMIFIRMQAANDSANLDDLRQFTTPEMFAALKLDLLERGSGPQTTEVQRVEAQVLDVAEEADRQIVSVRYRGEVVEEADAAPVAFDEVWHLVKPHGEGKSWAIAGIEQMS
jgi:predicted lipid-binding transport protein (Tim44 family)